MNKLKLSIFGQQKNIRSEEGGYRNHQKQQFFPMFDWPKYQFIHKYAETSGRLQQELTYLQIINNSGTTYLKKDSNLDNDDSVLNGEEGRGKWTKNNILFFKWKFTVTNFNW